LDPTTLGLLGLILTIGALALALRAQRDAKEQSETLGLIAESLSTRYEGVFPHYMPAIVSLLERANHRIDVLCDLPGYGELSDELAAEQIRSLLRQQKGRGVEVQITVYGSELQEEMLREQIRHQRDRWDEWLRSPDYGPKLRSYIERHGFPDELEQLTPDRYVALSLEVHRGIMEHDLQRFEPTTLRDPVPLYFWMIDGTEAVFAIPAYTADASEHGFYTSDARLIDALRTMCARFGRRSARSQGPVRKADDVLPGER
jgi:hypothetical protein